MDNQTNSSFGKDIDLLTFQGIVKSLFLRITDIPTFPPEMITIEGTLVGTAGNFSASVGKPKCRKTFALTALTASAISGKEVLRYHVQLSEGKHKVLYIDTEQSKYHCHKVLERIYKLAGIPTDTDCENLGFLMLREYSPKQRRQIINLMLESDQEYGLVIIDGVRDLLYDLNSPGESVDIINDLMRWSSTYNLHIHTVLHLNKSDDNTRGHVGTELNNKAETVIHISRSQFDDEVSEVRPMHNRDKDFVPFAFRINDEGVPVLEDKYRFDKESKVTKESIDDDEHKDALRIVFANGSIDSYKQLIKSLQEAYATIGFKRGRNVCIELNKYLIAKGFIIKSGKSYSLCSDFEEDFAEEE
jgi:KaiC/GvpD/RAD55 family RecA-like ATPase